MPVKQFASSGRMRTHDECNEFSRSCVKKETLRRRRRRNNNQQVKKKKGPRTLRDLLWMCAHGKVISREEEATDARTFCQKVNQERWNGTFVFFSTFIIAACSPFFLVSEFSFTSILLHLPSSQPSVVRAPVHMASPSPSAGKAPPQPPPVTFLRNFQVGDTHVEKDLLGRRSHESLD